MGINWTRKKTVKKNPNIYINWGFFLTVFFLVKNKYTWNINLKRKNILNKF